MHACFDWQNLDEILGVYLNGMFKKVVLALMKPLPAYDASEINRAIKVGHLHYSNRSNCYVDNLKCNMSHLFVQ